ncbi:30S ribosomal protein S17 [bacterium endosymbiont of Pedicinus badii]|uniref:30S ribosomal protein S17 n=1 Tax=bacterium endosymbiont of Pedicinus badii TaxID=1719126 RepID=UPI0009BB93F8|nr:30S ribosomal protein S17 [bacterium endosymbiont of Pedicinus badii]OQM34109.1 30S ribosomal protein S17 [bacterium endosymbiont of Pedicinus badii]
MSKKNSKTLLGYIVNNKMKKTIIVSVNRIVKHKIYKKIIRKTTKLQVHDEKNIGKIGDLVRIKECRPISKKKSWILIKIVQKTKNL